MEEVKKTRREETHLRLENPHINPSNYGAITLELAQREMEHRELLLRQREYEAELSAQQQMLAAMESQNIPEPPVVNQGDSLTDEVRLSPQALGLRAQVREVDRRIEQLKATRGMTDLHPEIQRLLTDRQWLETKLEHHGLRDSAAVSNGPLNILTPAGVSENIVAGQPWRGDQARLLVQIAAQKAKLKDVEISLQTTEMAMVPLRQAKQDVYQTQEKFAEAHGKVARVNGEHKHLETILAKIEPAITAVEQDRLLQFSEGEPARGSSRPISPKASTIVLLAVLAGIATGAAFVVLAEVFDRAFRNSGQVAQPRATHAGVHRRDRDRPGSTLLVRSKSGYCTVGGGLLHRSYGTDRIHGLLQH